jgi:adenine phosphoribosyltransferase
VDDVLATWGTMWAAIKLVERLGGKVDSLNFLMELSFLDGKKNISSYSINSLIQY